MSATDELRRLLDERGAVWDEYEFGDTTYTHWTNDDGLWCAASADGPSKLHVNILYTTPEQAVAATFGNGTCHIVKTWSDSDYDEDWRYRCSKCGCPIPVDERDPETGDVISAANYCPSCGRRVIE